jgi:outer membrane protein assembly factor BamB
VVGVDPASGVERFTLDFGPKFQFQTLIGSSGGGTVTIEGLQVQQESGEQTAATSTSVVLEADLHTRVATVMPISDTDANVSLSAVLTPSYAIYADGLHNVTARKSDGSVLWSYQVGPDLRHGPAVLGSTVFAIGRELIALDLRTGKVRWQARGDSGGFSALGVGDGTVFCAGSSSGVYAFDAADGSRRWFRDTPRLNTDNPIVSSAKTVFVPAFENKDGFYALGAAQGEVLWHFTDGRDTGINGWQLSCDSAGHLVAQHYDRTYCLPVR